MAVAPKRTHRSLPRCQLAAATFVAASLAIGCASWAAASPPQVVPIPPVKMEDRSSKPRTQKSDRPAILADGHIVYAQRQRTFQGMPADVVRYIHIDKDCRPTPIRIDIAQAPKHGEVRISEGFDFPRRLGGAFFMPNEIYFACNEKKVAISTVTYAPDPQYAGGDVFTLRFRGRGNDFSDEIRMTIYEK